jgi:hypothetical protein
MTRRDDLLVRLRQASGKGSLQSVLEDAIARIAKSSVCKIEASESRQSTAHYAFIYRRRADNPNPAVRAIPALLSQLGELHERGRKFGNDRVLLGQGQRCDRALGTGRDRWLYAALHKLNPHPRRECAQSSGDPRRGSASGI